jgi:hypothetical protein
MTRITETVFSIVLVGGQLQEVLEIYHTEPKKTWGGGLGDRTLVAKAVWINGGAFEFEGHRSNRSPEAFWRLRAKKRKAINLWTELV